MKNYMWLIFITFSWSLQVLVKLPFKLPFHLSRLATRSREQSFSRILKPNGHVAVDHVIKSSAHDY